jgi:glutamate dehydrogenase
MPAGDRETRLAEAVACYQTFMRGMLDITDNLEGDTVIPPARVVRHDDDDPYLVVAADKGTATFSDIANAIAAEYGFWLDDAFASGGSSGYDHKGMGITARGAWESVKRLFRERDSDIQTEPFTVVGIGDMSGDVFGNGMLLSRQIRLIAAFNHLHIFLDPDPDPERSFHERQRLFELPRSSWHDYDRDIISVGGGVWPRTSKSIEISSEVRSALGISSENLGPNELINAILKAPVDLLWNGGIGTYIKASTESHEDVRDRANDTIRVNGQELRCKVLGEGGNLGATQLGRIEFSRAGGLCHTDAIDNSAGVDTSDHEVNIKIALNHLVKRQELTLKQRNTLLSGMTEEVAELVLRDNYNQTQALSLAVDRAGELVHQHARATRQLERTGVLDPRLEFLPDEEVFAERIAAGEGLCRPEMAVLLSYSKLSTYELLLESDVPEDPFLSGELPRYFPTVLSEQYPEAITTHRLRREIIATQVTNSMVNRVGPGFTLRMNELTGRLPPDTARAYSATCEIFAIRDLWQAVESLDNTVDAAVQRAILHDAGRLIERGTTWLLRNRPQTIDIAETVAFFRDDVAQLWDSFPRVLAASNRLTQKRRVRRFLAAEIPPELANQAAGLLAMSAGLDIVEIARMDRHDVSDTATVYYDLGDRLGLHWLRDRISELAVESHWHSMSKFALRTDLSRSQRALAGSVLNGSTSKGKTAVRQWVTRQKAACDRFDQIISDLRLAGKPDFAMLSVAVSEAKVLQGDTGA